jgi:hypothetical protein
MPPVARPFPRFIADTAQESRPYGRWEERLTESFTKACEELESGTTLDLESVRFFPERTWGGRTYIPVVGHGAGELDGVIPEFFGHISFPRVGETDPGELLATVDFTDVTAAENPEWEVDLNDDVVGEWRADGGRGGDVTLIWGTPLVRGAIAATAELGGEVIDQAAVNDGRFTLFAVDAVEGFGDELYLEVKLWDRRLRTIASESLYAEEEDEDEIEEDDEDETQNGSAPPAP